MNGEIKNLVELVESRGKTEEFAHLPLPRSMKAATVHRKEVDIFKGLETRQKDPRKSLHLDEVPLPPIGPNDVLVAVMAAAVNYNNVWTSIFEPMPGFNFLAEFAKLRSLNACHVQDYHIIGSDAAGVVLRVGAGVTRWKPGDRVTLYGGVVDPASPEAYDDSVRDPHASAWGFETNFGAFAEFTVVRENQLLPKPEHLSWEEAASITLVASTAYRMLVSKNGAQMKQGDNVLVWGASGGLGVYGIQFALNGGAFPIGVVSSERKAEVVRRMGCPAVIVLDRGKGEASFVDDAGQIQQKKILRLKAKIRKLTGGEDCDIVFEHTGRATFSASVALAKTGGKVVTCGSTSGYDHVYDNRYLWQTVKSIIGSHGANYHEAMETARLACKGAIYPVLSEVFRMDDLKEALFMVHQGHNVGKIGVLCLSNEEGKGIVDYELRERVGEERINLFRSLRRMAPNWKESAAE